jgi:iron complex outermembrane receptor protein
VRLFTDGIPATMPDGQGQAASFNLDLAERIEVLRGPYSVVYGNHAGGVIQLFTREPEAGDRIEMRATGGSYDTWKLDANAQGRVGGFGYLLDASRFSTTGYRAHSAATRDQGLVKLSTALEDDGKLTFILNHLDQDGTQDPLGLSWASYQHDPRSVESVALTFNTRKSIDHSQVGAHYERGFAGGRLDLIAFYGERGVLQFQSIPPGPQAAPRSPGGVIDFARAFGGFDARWTHTVAVDAGTFSTTVGLDVQRSRDDRRGYQNFVGTELGVLGALRRNEIDRVTSIDPYLQLEWARGPWAFTTGLRRNDLKFAVDDRYFANGNDSGEVRYRQTTGMLGASFKLGAQTSVYVAAAKGLESPTLNELFYSGSGGGFNFGLKAARSKHLEAGLKTQIAKGVRAELAAYEVRTSDELIVDTATGGRTSYRNAARTLRQGVETSLQTQLPAGFSASVALSAGRAVYDAPFSTSTGVIEAGRRMPAVPAISGFAEFAWRDSASGRFAAVELHGRGRLEVEDSNAAPPAPGFASLSLRAGTEFRIVGWVASPFLRVDNVFDRQYVGSVIVGESNRRYYEPAPGLSFLAGIQLRSR